MQKIYLLLRNNKQSGPHSLSELIALQLKPFDLIWVEGRSKSWEYPTELNELKGHVKEDKKKKESVTVYPQEKNQLVLPRTTNKPKEGKTKEDKINVQVYVKLPHESEGERFFSDNNQLLHSDDSSVNQRASGPVVQNADGLLNTKYTRDLQEIKEEYTAWIGQRKQSQVNKQQNKPWLIWAIIAFLGMAGFLSERWANTTGNQMVNPDTMQAKKVIVTPVLKPSKTKKNTRSTEKADKSKKAASGTDAAQEDKKDKKKTADSTATAVKETKQADAKALLKLVDISFTSDTGRHAGINGIIFTIHNRSIHKLNTVAVNVYYNDTEGHVVSKETIHFNNVQSGATVSEAAPSNDRASEIHFKVALINTEELTFHAKE